MRRFWMVAALAGGLVLGSRASAQTIPGEMVVTAPRVEVRSGPTEKYLPTSILTQGERVLVLRESKDQPGWLAIKPPDKSFSWVNAKFAKKVDERTYYVDTEAPVLPGSAIANKPPNVESEKKLQPGSIVVLVDKALTVDGEAWLPIQPPLTDVRFIPASAVRAPGAGTPLAPPTGNPLIAQAEKAFTDGKIELARSLYKEAAEKTASFQEKTFCYQRLMSLEKGPTGPGHPFHMAAGSATPPAPFVSAAGTVVTSPPQWSSWGILRKAAFEKAGQPVFILESKEGRALMFVQSGPGTSLRDYVGRMVCLYGAVSYRTDDPARTPYFIASHVAVP